MARSESAGLGTWGWAAAVALISWLVPGAGHVVLGKRIKGLVFFLLVVLALIFGSQLDGRLYQPVTGQPLSMLGTLASLGSGLGYLGLRFLLDYHGDVVSRGYEYGTAFLITAGLMNWLVVLDVWDRARGLAVEPAAAEPPGEAKTDETVREGRPS